MVGRTGARSITSILMQSPPDWPRGAAALFEDKPAMSTESFIRCHFLDGGIIGGPPAQTEQDGNWKKTQRGAVGRGGPFPQVYSTG